MYIIGDVHGCLRTLKALVSKLPDWKEKRIAFVGDLIDRGPDSRGVVEYVMDLCEKGYADCVKGNHEDMMIDHGDGLKLNPRGHYMLKDNIWTLNGGRQTLLSYYKDEEPFDLKAFDEHRLWMDNLPVYIEYPELTNEGRYLVVSHSHVSPLWQGIKENDPSSLDWDGIHAAIMWGRPQKFKHAEQNLDIYNVIGHTPREKARIRSFYANVDSGCFYRGGRKGEFAHLTALEFPSMKLYTHGLVDDVNWY